MQAKVINLEVDHIIPLRDSLELALDINNGRTLCKSCHEKTDTYGAKAWR
jgi:5-methylcytosine-specific restriction endonuclease McrA